LSHEAVRSLDILLKRPLQGVRRLLAYGVFALSPELWHSVLGYGHIEHPLMLFLVVASVRSLLLRRADRAGILLGLALLTRSSAILYLLPLTLLLMAERHWWEALRFFAGALLTLAIGLLPFALVDRSDLVYSLLTFHGLLPAGGGSVWGVFEGTSLSQVGDHYDSFFVIGSCLVLPMVLLFRYRTLRLGSGDIYGILALCGLCFPLLLKTLWPYYYLDAYMFLALWWLASARPLPSLQARVRWLMGAGLPLSAVLAGQLAEYGLTSSGGSWTTGWSITMTGVTLAMMALILAILEYGARLHRFGPMPAQADTREVCVADSRPLAGTI
jgi:4-amino-4-deoxy-L-arabinose transferase-like glycosyltransferase